LRVGIDENNNALTRRSQATLQGTRFAAIFLL
jgi:hypothetical protein